MDLWKRSSSPKRWWSFPKIISPLHFLWKCNGDPTDKIQFCLPTYSLHSWIYTFEKIIIGASGYVIAFLSSSIIQTILPLWS